MFLVHLGIFKARRGFVFTTPGLNLSQSYWYFFDQQGKTLFKIVVVPLGIKAPSGTTTALNYLFFQWFFPLWL